MSATTQVRIRNREGVVLTKNGTYLTHVEIDPFGQSDFARSYLDIHIMFKGQGGEYIYGETIYMGDITTATKYDGQCLIRNCRLSCEQLGILEENLKVNVYHQTLSRLLKSQQMAQSEEVFGNEYVVPDPESGMAHILVPLSSILGLGNQVYDNQRCGSSTLRLELEFQLDLFYRDTNAQDALFEMALEEIENETGNALPVSSITIAPQFADEDTFNQYFYVGQVYTITGQAGDDEVDVAGTLASYSWNATANEATLNFEEQLFTLGVDEAFDGGLISSLDGEECDPINVDDTGNVISIRVTTGDADDFYPNTQMKVGYYDNADDAFHITNGTIATAVQDDAGVIITFTQNIVSSITEGTDLTEVFCVNLNLNPVSWEVHQIDLVLHKLLQPVKMGKMVYDTWSLEQTNQPQTSNYRKQFYTEDDVYKFAYLTPNSTLISEVNNANNYRFTLNNIDLTNRDIPIDFATNNSLYNDRLIMNVDGLASVQPSPSGTLQTAVYPDRCPIGQRNMVELQLSNSNGEAMAEVVGHFFKIRARQV
jgi:hypothetical protein